MCRHFDTFWLFAAIFGSIRSSSLFDMSRVDQREDTVTQKSPKVVDPVPGSS